MKFAYVSTINHKINLCTVQFGQKVFYIRKHIIEQIEELRLRLNLNFATFFEEAMGHEIIDNPPLSRDLYGHPSHSAGFSSQRGKLRQRRPVKGRSEINPLAIDSSFFLHRGHPVHLVRSSAPQGKGKICPPLKKMCQYMFLKMQIHLLQFPHHDWVRVCLNNKSQNQSL